MGEGLERVRSAWNGLWIPQELVSIVALTAIIVKSAFCSEENATLEPRPPSMEYLRNFRVPIRTLHPTPLFCLLVLMACGNRSVNAPTKDSLVQFCGATYRIDVKNVECVGYGAIDLSPLRKLSKLKNLSLSHVENKSVVELRHLRRLENLSLAYLETKNLTPLAHLTRLKRLHISGVDFDSVASLATLTRLKELAIYQAHGLVDVTPLRGLTKLHTLALADTGVTDLVALDSMSELRELTVWLSPVESIEPLRGLRNLEGLDIGFTRVHSVAPLNDMSRLRWINIHGLKIEDCTALKRQPPLQFRSFFGTRTGNSRLTSQMNAQLNSQPASAPCEIPTSDSP